MNEISLGFTIWLSWGLVGLILGYMAARLVKATSMWLNIIVGIVSAIGGGWLFVHLLGATDKMIYVSLLVAMAISGLFLWIIYLFGHHSQDPDDIE